MRILKARAQRTGPKPEFKGGGPGPKPGMEGTMRLKAWVGGVVVGGFVSGVISLRASRKEPGQPWTKRRGMALEWDESWWAK